MKFGRKKRKFVLLRCKCTPGFSSCFSLFRRSFQGCSYRHHNVAYRKYLKQLTVSLSNKEQRTNLSNFKRLSAAVHADADSMHCAYDMHYYARRTPAYVDPESGAPQRLLLIGFIGIIGSSSGSSADLRSIGAA